MSPNDSTVSMHDPALADWFQSHLLDWFDVHGRKDLPWQHNPTPYRVWVSEIMLQQTQVATVIDYYQRFMNCFPDLASLAAAPIDDVLHLWSGLGYYARGRNLHRSAGIIFTDYEGIFPDDIDTLIQLPGIGRSTAAAILALSGGQHHAILDGNVKRVLTRFAAIEGWPGKTDVQKKLWKLAEQLTPAHRVGPYTQAIMDLGASLCSRSRPQCSLCPVRQRCQAYAQQRTSEFPQSKPRKRLPVRQSHLLLLSNNAGQILLQQRPPTGIWGGLWSLPECPEDEPKHAGATELWIQQQFGASISRTGDTLRHTFSHFHLDITPVLARTITDESGAATNAVATRIMDEPQRLWYNLANPQSLGLAAPIKTLLAQYQYELTTIKE